MKIKEVGIEKECFLMKGNKIMEPRMFGFPKDEFEFLVELRSLPSDRFYPVYTSLKHEELQYSLRANKFDMELNDEPNKTVTKKFVDDLWNKYNLHRFNDKDFTKNIYNDDNPSHHFGVLSTDKEDNKRLTAGIHVHFSSRDSKTGEVIYLPEEEIIRKMDHNFKHEIHNAGRNLGEYEMKTHGFEYRSLPSNIDIYKVLKIAFKILREV